MKKIVSSIIPTPEDIMAREQEALRMESENRPTVITQLPVQPVPIIKQ